MILKSFLPIIFLFSFTMITARGQAIAHFEFDDNATLTQNLVGPDALRINPNARSNGEGVYSLGAGEGYNIELVLPLSLFSSSENIYMEFDFQVQENYAWLISAGEYEWPNDEREFFAIGYLHSEGFRLRYYTHANPNTLIDSDFIQAPGVPLNLNERAKISFIYDKEEGIAYLLKNGNEIWRTPADQQTPGAAFLWFAKNDEITVASGMNGEGSTTPSLYSFKAFNEACGNITAPVADDVEICGPGTATLTAGGADEGNYRWYETEDATEAFEGETASTFTTPPLNANTTFYVSHMQGPCESERIAVNVEVLPLPEAPVGLDNGICGPGRVTIEATATGVQDGNFRWYDSEDALQPIPGATGSTYTTEPITDSKTFYVAIEGTNGCESERIPVQAIINEIPDLPTVVDGKRCGPGKVNLIAMGGAEGNYRWYESMTATTALPGSTGRNFETPEITTTTTYYVAAVNENDENCESSRVAVTAEIVPLPDAPVAQDVPHCGPGSVRLTASASGRTDGQYRWYNSANATTAIDGAVNGVFDTPLLNSTTTYYVSVMDGDCESERTAVTAQILPLPDAPTVENGEICGPGQVTLTATADGAQDGDYRWYESETALQPIQGAIQSSYTTDMLNASKTYYVAVVDDSSCESKRTKVEAIIHQMPPSALTQNLERCGPGEQNITIQTDGGDSTPPAIFKWYSQQQDVAPALETTSATLLVSVQKDTTLYVSTSNGNCEGNKVAVNVKVNPIPLIDAGEDQTILRGESVQLQAKGANGESIVCSWSSDESLDRTDIPAPMATPLTSTQYIVTRTDDLTGCSNSDTVMVYVVEEFPVPNAFSPNNDGRNDLWEIPNIENYPDCVIKVFNNWGNKVFESQGYTTPWDGTLQGQEIPPGTYFYVLQLSREHQGVKGSLLIMR